MRASPQTDPVQLNPLPPKQLGGQGRKNKSVTFLLRMNPHLKEICVEAAQREGISLNIWALRVLAEHAKRSRDGWRTIPVDDPPRSSDSLEPPAPAMEPDQSPQTDIEEPSPHTSDGGPWAERPTVAHVEFQPPESDIPTF